MKVWILAAPAFALLLTGCSSTAASSTPDTGGYVVQGCNADNCPTTPRVETPLATPTAPATPVATPAPVAAPALACLAVKLANQGDWMGSASHFVDIENAMVSDRHAVTGYAQLGMDALKVAEDPMQNLPTAPDVATYRADLAIYADLVSGC